MLPAERSGRYKECGRCRTKTEEKGADTFTEPIK